MHSFTDDNLPTDVQEEITPLLSVACYRQFVVPMLIKIFKVHDHHIRMVLLQYFTHYAHLIDPEILECVIFPQVINEPRRKKTGLRGFRPGPTQTGLYSHCKRLKA